MRVNISDFAEMSSLRGRPGSGATTPREGGRRAVPLGGGRRAADAASLDKQNYVH